MNATCPLPLRSTVVLAVIFAFVVAGCNTRDGTTMVEKEFLRDPTPEECREALVRFLTGNLDGAQIELSLRDVITSPEDVNYLKAAPIRKVNFPNYNEVAQTVIGPWVCDLKEWTFARSFSAGRCCKIDMEGRFQRHLDGRWAASNLKVGSSACGVPKQ